MRLRYTEPFLKDFEALSEELKKRTDKQLNLLLQNPRHPSLQTRKWRKDPTGKTWYARVTKDFRFTFEIQSEVYVLRRVGHHKLIE
jgi:mRNA-degrading endonuclease RelE of RelBE toxin-antitoxin system